MAIKPIDALAGAELVRRQTLHPTTQRASPPTAAPDPAAKSIAEAEKAKAEPHTPVEALSSQIDTLGDNVLRFEIDRDTGKAVAKLVDKSGQVLRQIPSEQAIEAAKAMNKYRGMFVNRKV